MTREEYIKKAERNIEDEWGDIEEYIGTLERDLEALGDSRTAKASAVVGSAYNIRRSLERIEKLVGEVELICALD